MKMFILRRNFTKSSILRFKQEFLELPGEEFRVLVIPGHSKTPIEKRELRRQKKPAPPPRYKSMPIDQDWTNVWPTAHSFSWSVIPFPVRQGYVEKSENDGIIPVKYGNAELMKIPNFLHLTPSHIKKHCAALKQFCTPWPEALSDEIIHRNFPITIETHDVVTDAVMITDDRARKVSLQLRLLSLHLDAHARDKFIRLAHQRYNAKTDILTFETDACPLRKQNYDYLIYQLKVIYHESWKTEEWESEKTLQDMEKYYWDINSSKSKVLNLIKHMKQKKLQETLPKSIKSLPENCSDDTIVDQSEIKEYKLAIERILNGDESVNALDDYKQTVQKLFLQKYAL